MTPARAQTASFWLVIIGLALWLIVGFMAGQFLQTLRLGGGAASSSGGCDPETTGGR